MGVFEAFPQLFLNTLITGGLYALLGFGFSLTLNAVRILPFFFGGVSLIGAYMMHLLRDVYDLSIFVALLLSVCSTVIFNILLNNFLFRQFRQKKVSSFNMIVVGIAIGIFIENLLLLSFGPDVKTIPLPRFQASFEIFGGYITLIQLIIALASLPILGLSLYIFYKRFCGISLRALIDQPEMAQVLGLNAEKAFLLIFTVVGIIAGLSGILYGAEYNIEPFVGVSLTIKAFVATVIGGKDVVPAAILGGYLLGAIENLASFYLPSSFKEGISFVTMFIFLLFKPNGLVSLKLREETAG